MTSMEIVCIDKQTFEELRVRFSKLEEKSDKNMPTGGRPRLKKVA